MAKSHLEKCLGRRRRTMFVHSGANVTFPVMSVVAFSARKNTPQRTVCYRFTDGDRTVRTHSGWRGSVKNLAVLLPTRGCVPSWCDVCFSAFLSARGPLRALPVPDRSVHQGPGCQSH